MLLIIRFIRNEEEDAKLNTNNPSKEEYGGVLARKYYEKLYKEFAIVELSKVATGQFTTPI